MRHSHPAVVPQSSAALELKGKAATACLVAKDAIANLLELFEESSRMAYLTVRDCERELDTLEREIDEKLPGAITRVGERKARELIASLRFITDLERIGDLVWWIAQRLNENRPRFPKAEADAVTSMASILISMMDDINRGFSAGDASVAQAVIARDRDVDALRQKVFTFELASKNTKSTSESVEILFIVQALERAGDHITNLAEELIHLSEGRSVRHLVKKTSEG